MQSGRSVRVDAGDGGDVIQMNGGRGGVEPHRPMETGIVEEIHLDVLHKVALRVGGTIKVYGACIKQ